MTGTTNLSAAPTGQAALDTFLQHLARGELTWFGSRTRTHLDLLEGVFFPDKGGKNEEGETPEHAIELLNKLIFKPQSVHAQDTNPLIVHQFSLAAIAFVGRIASHADHFYSDEAFLILKKVIISFPIRMNDLRCKALEWIAMTALSTSSPRLDARELIHSYAKDAHERHPSEPLDSFNFLARAFSSQLDPNIRRRGRPPGQLTPL